MENFVFPWPSVVKDYSIKVASVLDDSTFWEYENSVKKLRHLRNRHEWGMFGIRGLSLFQAYYSYLEYTSAAKAPTNMRLAILAGRIAAFLVVADTANFNLYFYQTSDIVVGHIMMREEYARKKIEEEGHPDDIYIIKPETKKDS